jgi:MFS family permease
VMPRMRATAGAYFILVNTFLGLALGPYFIGQFSDMFFATGMSDSESLRWAIGVSMFTFVPALIFFYLAQKHLPAEEASRLQRAHDLGEKVN